MATTALPAAVDLRLRAGRTDRPARFQDGTMVRLLADATNRFTGSVVTVPGVLFRVQRPSQRASLEWSETQGVEALGGWCADIEADEAGEYVARAEGGGATVELRFTVGPSQMGAADLLAVGLSLPVLTEVAARAGAAAADGVIAPQVKQVDADAQAVEAARGQVVGIRDALPGDVAAEIGRQAPTIQAAATEAGALAGATLRSAAIATRVRALAAADIGKTLLYPLSQPGWIDVPAGLPEGFQVLIMPTGIAPVRFRAAPGVVIASPANHNGAGTRYGAVALVQIAPDTYAIGGWSADVTAAYEPVIDYPPGISGITFRVSEGAPIGTVVGQVTATGAGPIGFSIRAGNAAGKFAIDPDTGVIRTAGPLDYETVAAYTLTVAAANLNPPASTATVQILLDDVLPVEPLPGQEFGIAEDAAIGTLIGPIQVASGAANVAIVSGNGAGDFTLDGANLRSAHALSYARQNLYTLGVTNTDGEGTSRAIPMTVNILKAATTYAPITDGAWAAFDPADTTHRTVDGNGRITLLSDQGPQGAAYAAETDTTTYPIPLLYTGANGINGLDILRAYDMSRLRGNAVLASAARDTDYFGIEFVYRPESVATNFDILSFSVGTGTTARFGLSQVLVNSIPVIRLASRRLDNDAAVLSTSATRLYTAKAVYVFVGVDYANRQAEIRVDGVAETFSDLAWVSGAGRTSNTSSSRVALGYSTTNSRLQMGTQALYRAKPTSPVLLANRQALKTRYGLG